MRHIGGAAVAIALAGISALCLWRAKTLAERDLGVLTTPLDRLVSHWDAEKVPSAKRVIQFVISDADSDPDPTVVPPAPDWSRTASEWVKSRMIGGNPSLETVDPVDSISFVRPFKDDPNAIVWSHDGFSAASPDQMAAEIVKALRIATAAGAEINIVAQGMSAAPVLKALQDTEGQRVKDDNIGANKVVFVGMSWPRLKQMPPFVHFDVSKLNNVFETATIYADTKEMNQPKVIEISKKGHAPTAHALSTLWPGQGNRAADYAQLVKGLVGRVETLEQIVAAQNRTLQEASDRDKAAMSAAEEARRKAEAEADAMERAAAEARRRAHAAELAARVGEPSANERLLSLSRHPNADANGCSGLIAAGAAPNARDRWGGSPLWNSVRIAGGVNASFVQCLVDNGADVNAADEHGRTVLMGVDNPDNARLLLGKGANVKARDEGGQTVLFALPSGSRDAVELARLYIDHGADVNATDNGGMTPLMESVSHRSSTDDLELMRAFLDKGANVNARDKNGVTALMKVQELKTAQLLVEKGADVNAKDNRGYTPLLCAVCRTLGESGVACWMTEASHSSFIRLLLEHGADVKARTDHGETALMCASKSTKEHHPETDIIQLLYQYGERY